jgi:uncharacterized protein (TIGR00296 family)
MSLSDEDGESIVRLARSTIDSYVREGKPHIRSLTTGRFAEYRGVFVTVNLASEGPDKLRGCIGFPQPVKTLGQAVQEASIAASTEDPRFPPVGPQELDSILVEVSVLTKPTELEVEKRKDAPKGIKIGRDGLIISNSYTSGLLLPQVATEYNFDADTFLSQACMKAGLPPDAWLDPETTIHVFQAEVFSETTPRGKVERIEGR